MITSILTKLFIKPSRGQKKKKKQEMFRIERNRNEEEGGKENFVL